MYINDEELSSWPWNVGEVLALCLYVNDKMLTFVLARE